MTDFSGIGVVVVFILLIILALLVLLKLLDAREELIEAQQVSATPIPMDEGKFLAAFLKPVYEDGLDELDTAVETIRDGLHYYGHGAYTNAGEAFIDAGRSIDAASAKFREVLAMVEDPEEHYARLSKARLAEGKRFMELAKDMEKASDAMIAGRAADAAALNDQVSSLRKLADEWQKDNDVLS